MPARPLLPEEAMLGQSSAQLDVGGGVLVVHAAFWLIILRRAGNTYRFG